MAANSITQHKSSFFKMLLGGFAAGAFPIAGYLSNSFWLFAISVVASLATLLLVSGKLPVCKKKLAATPLIKIEATVAVMVLLPISLALGLSNTWGLILLSSSVLLIASLFVPAKAYSTIINKQGVPENFKSNKCNDCFWEEYHRSRRSDYWHYWY